MNTDPSLAADILTRRFFIDHSLDAAMRIEQLRVADVVEAVARQPAEVLAPVWRRLLPDTAAALLRVLPDDLADRLLAELPPQDAVRILGHMPRNEADKRLERLDGAIAKEIEGLLSFPAESAGRIMNPRIAPFRRQISAGEALNRLRDRGMKTARSLFLVDDAQRLTGKVALADVALVDPETTLETLEQPVQAVVRPIDPGSDVSRIFETQKVLDVPVVDLDGVFLGAVTHDDLAHAIQEDATADLQTMVGAGKEERALSNPILAVRKRMPWLQINLLTAFLAAAVVGVFEATIAQVTALAVLLPVVAGQSGNAGAQALAVTMRGLALREITVRQWARVMRKEVAAGILNGAGIAVTCGVGTYVWSQSIGLAGVIASSMILAMVSAGFAGAVIPIVLTRLGQDPATASSIILTTVTDIAGFFSFLGIATLLMQYL